MTPTEEMTYRNSIYEHFDDLKESIDSLTKQVSYTNGKVRKIIIALVLIFGILIGENFNAHQILTLLFSGLH